MKKIKFVIISAFLFLAIAPMLNSCRKDSSATSAPAVTHYFIRYSAGSNWVSGTHINMQNISNHFNYQIGLFGQGILKTAGFFIESAPNDDKGNYLQHVTTSQAIDSIVNNDPAVQQNVLKVQIKEPVAMLQQQYLDTNLTRGKIYFLVDYKPGSNWVQGKKIWEQNLTSHQAYMVQLFANKKLLRQAQYLNIDMGYYVFLATSLSEVQSLISADPAVTSGIFSPQINTWAVVVDQL